MSIDLESGETGVSDADFDSYWRRVLEEVEALRDSPVEVEELALRSNEASTAYGVRFSGIGGYPLFAYLCVPIGDGPSPALFDAPGYGSVVAVPDFERRRRYTVMALCHRGQRLSDDPYSAQYPGLLTDGLQDADGYRWREIAADCLRALDVLSARPEADTARLAVAGNDLAVITAALRPSVRFLLANGQLLFRAAPPTGAGYPLQELDDYLRLHPRKAEDVARTVSLFDPARFAPRIEAETLVVCSEGGQRAALPFVRALGDRGELAVRSGRGHLDHAMEEEWLSERATPPSQSSPEDGGRG